MPMTLVDADDLETLLFAVNAIQGVEAALQQRERDPLVRSTKGKLSGAHDRLAAAWRRSKREDPPSPDAGDIAELRAMFTDKNGELTYETVVPHYPQRLAQTLQLVESGPCWEGVKIDWPAPATPQFHPRDGVPRGYGVRLMPRGESALKSVAGIAIQETKKLPAPGDVQ